MNAYVSNYGLLAGWLRYLEEVNQPLVGDHKDKILATAKKFELMPKERSLCVDAALAGDSTVSFLLKFNSQEFAEAPTEVAIKSRYDNFIRLYQETVGEPRGLALELDTNSEETLRSFMFLNLDKANAELVIPKVLAWQGEQKRMAGIRKLLDRAEAFIPTRMGFMFGQNKMPFRLSFLLKGTEFGKPINFAPFVELLELSGMPGYRSIERDLKQITQTCFAGCIMNLDLLPMGNLNGTVGFELYHGLRMLDKQAEFLESQEYGSFVKLLQQWRAADQRMDKLRQCIFYAPISQAMGNKEYLVSSLSHFTLRYNRGIRQTAKVCLEAERLQE